MALRFRKSIKLFPGVRLNVGKTGVSTSVGVKGLSMNVGRGGRRRVTTGIPGTGLSASHDIDSPTPKSEPRSVSVIWIIAALLFFFWLFPNIL